MIVIKAQHNMITFFFQIWGVFLNEQTGFSFGFATGTSLDTRNKELHVFVGTIKV